jgi:hypothetical protein
VIQIPLPRSCEYHLKLSDGTDYEQYGEITLQTVPAGVYAFSGTSLDFAQALLAPVPSGVQDVTFTCTFRPRPTSAKTANSALRS